MPACSVGRMTRPPIDERYVFEEDRSKWLVYCFEPKIEALSIGV